ncbi:MAG: hypothetical protein PF450_04350 [Bacteroidales bacterium]|nr:hypothetical protein [Bacteroidales bacterium]
MQVFIDAGGKAGNQRVWGGLVTIGESEITWIQQVLNAVGEDCNEDFELKGRELETTVIKAAGRKILDEDRRILFWANWLLDWKDEKSQKFAEKLGGTLNSLKSNPYHLERDSIETWYNENAGYFSGLKPVNQHKLLSIILHVQWLIAEIKRTRLGRQLKSVRVVIDKENFPNEARCGVVVKAFVAAGLQGAGMDCSLTGKAFREEANEGSVIVNVSGKSEKHAGIRYVDILLQAVLRKVHPII